MSGGSLAWRVFVPFGGLLNFSGRMTRGDFWPFMALLIGACVIAYATSTWLAFNGHFLPIQFFRLAYLLWAFLAFGAVCRRLHDMGWSGHWMGLYLLLLALPWILFLAGVRLPANGVMTAYLVLTVFGPDIFFFALLALCVQPSTTGPNRYGPNPRYDPPGEPA